MQTIIENLLTVVGNIPGIDEAVYSNIYDIEQTDKIVFVIVPGDISENLTAYLVNGSIQLMSKVMLVLKSKYIETNMVITSKDNIKEFSLDNCSGVYNVIKYKLIYKREDCGDSYEGMFVKSVNGLHGEVFLDIPQKISDLPNDVGYITEEDLPDYTDKFNEIDSSISDVSTRVHDIEKDYTTREYVDEKISEIVIESGVKSVNGMTGDVILNIPGKVSDLTQDIDYITENEADSKYMQKGDVPTDVYTKDQIDKKFTDSSVYNKNTYAKKTDIPDVKDFATRDELNSSINNVSTYISNTYAKKSDIPTIDTYTKSEIDKKDSDVLTLAKGYTEQEVQELSDYVDSTFATKEEIPTDYVKTEDYNKFVSDQATVDSTQNDAIAANTQQISDMAGSIEGKQDLLIPGVNIKTINNISLLGSGNIDVSAGDLFKLTDKTIVLIGEEKQTTYTFIADINDSGRDSSVKSIQINKGQKYKIVRDNVQVPDDNPYYKNLLLIGRNDAEAMIIDNLNDTFVWNYNSFNTKDYFTTDTKVYNAVYFGPNGGQTGKLYSVQEQESTKDEKTLHDYIVSLVEEGTKVFVTQEVLNSVIQTVNSSISDVSSRVKTNTNKIADLSTRIEDVSSKIGKGYITEGEFNIYKVAQLAVNGAQDISIYAIEDVLDGVNEVIKKQIPQTYLFGTLDDDTKDLPKHLEDYINYRNQVIDDTYARKEDIPVIPDYSDKFDEIDSSISDVSTRVKSIEDDYVVSDDIKDFITSADIPDYTDKFNDIDSSIGDVSTKVHDNAENIARIELNYVEADKVLDNKIEANTEEINKVSGRVSDIEADYVKGDQIKDFITEEDLPDYSPKFAEIDSSISDVSTRVSDIEKDYVKNNQIEDFITEEDLPDYTEKFTEIDSSIENVSTRVKNIEDDYVKHEEIPVIPDYTNKFNEIDSSIENVSTRVKFIEDDYLNSEDKTELEGKISDVEGKIPTDYVKDSDYNTKVSEIDSSIENVSTRVKTIEDDYVKADDIKDNVKSDYLEGRISDISSAIAAEGDAANKYTDGQIEFLDTDVSSRISKLNVSVNNEINRIWEKENTQDSDISDIKDFIDDVPNTYLKIEDLPDYTEKFTEIDSSISDVSTRVENIENDYLKSADKTELEGKIQEVADNIPTDYVHTDDYNTKVSEIDSSISDVSTRVKSIEDAGYVTDSEVDTKIDNIEFPVKSVNGMTGEVVIKTTSTDYVDLQIKNVSTYVEDNFAKKTEIPTDYVKIEDYNSDKYAQTAIDEAQNSAIEGISDDLENKVDKSTLEDYYTKTEVDSSIADVIVNASVNYLLKTDYVAPDVDKKYVEDRLADVSTEIQRVEDLIPEIPDYTDKFAEIDSSISDVSIRVKTNTENIASVDTKIDEAIERIDGEIGAHTEQINSVSGRVSTIEEDYVKSDDIKDFITEEDLPDYTEKFNEIDSSISDVSTRVKNVSDSLSDYATTDYVDGKVSDIEGQIDTINTNLGNKVESSDFNTYKTEQSNIDAKQTQDIAAIAEDYVKSADIKDFITEEDLPDYTEKFAEIDSSIENVSTRVKSIEDDYVKHDELPIVPDYTEKFNEIDSSISDVSARIDEIRLFKFPNVTIIGEPTISNGQISDFSTSDYLEFPFMVDFRDRGFEINFHIFTGSDVTNQQNILDSEYGLAFAVRDSHFVMAVSSNGTSWNLGEIIGTNTIIPNRNYYVKISYDRFTYKIEYKEDITGEYITDATKVVAAQGPYPKQMFIGVGGIYASTQNYFKGMINLNYANLKINNELVWQGMDDVGLSTRLAIDLGNIDAAGIKKLKEIIATEGYIKELPDSLVSKDELNTSIANVSSWVSNNYAKKTSLDSYLLISDAQNTYATQGQLNGLSGRVEELDGHITDVYTFYDPKITNINSSISDISTRLADIKVPTDYVHTDTYNVKIAEIDSSISNVSTRIKSIEDDYLKGSDKSYLEGLISGKQNTLVSGTNIKTINGEDILGSGNIEIQGGGGSGYTKEEVDKMFSDSSTYVSRYYVTQRSGSFTYLQSNPLSLYKNYAASSDGQYNIKVGTYNTESGSTNDPYSIVFNYNEYGQNNNGIYMFTRGKIYAKQAGKFSSNIEDDRLASMADLNEKLGDINTILESI